MADFESENAILRQHVLALEHRIRMLEHNEQTFCVTARAPKLGSIGRAK